MTQSLVEYIEFNIFPQYEQNDAGHQLSHIQYVIGRSMRFAEQAEAEPSKYGLSAKRYGLCSNESNKINYDMVYTVAAYHDIGHHIDPKRHEIVSADMLAQDENLRRWFNKAEISMMYDAIADHRASGDEVPRNVYGKIVSSADRNTSVDSILKRTYAYRRKHNPEMGWRQIMKESYKHISDKFGPNGYAVEKMYFDDPEYDKFIEHVFSLIENKDAFEKEFIVANKLNKDALREQIENYSPWNEQEIIDK